MEIAFDHTITCVTSTQKYCNILNPTERTNSICQTLIALNTCYEKRDHIFADDATGLPDNNNRLVSFRKTSVNIPRIRYAREFHLGMYKEG